MDEKISFIRHYQSSIEKSLNNPERVLHCLKKLQNLKVNVQDLQETGIGKTVNALRKIDGEAGELATKLVTKWKDQISKMSDDDLSSPTMSSRETREKEHSDSTSKKNHHSSTKSSSSTDNIDSNSKKSKSHSSSTSSHHHHSSNSKSSHNNHSSEQHKEKDRKSSENKSSENSKHHKSHHSASSHKTSSSSSSQKRSREDFESKENETKVKKIKSDHEKSSRDSKKSSSKYSDEAKESTSNGTSSKSKQKDSKSSSLKRKHSNEEAEEFDGMQGMGFAEALAAFDIPSSSKHRKKDQLADKIVSVKSGSSSSKSKSSSSSSKKEKEKLSSSSSSSLPSTSSSEFKKPVQNLTQPPKLLTQKPKLDLLPDIVNELPNDVSIPEYRPIPMNSAMKEYILGSNSQSRHTKVLSDGDLLAQSFSSKANRTRVFSGNSKTRSEIPKLFDMCIRILQENIDFLECTGGVPFEILKPVLERAKPEQLQVIEYYNPYLLDDSDILWKPHCQRKWKNKQPLESEMETWREMYERCTREDEEKLSRLTQNIRKQQVISSSGIQKTKMAFVDTTAKAPRGVVRKQEQFGTSRKLVVSPAARVEALKNLQPNLAVPGDVRLRVAAGLRDDAQQIVGRNVQKPNLGKKAPMMAKILSKFRR